METLTNSAGEQQQRFSLSKRGDWLLVRDCFEGTSRTGEYSRVRNEENAAEEHVVPPAESAESGLSHDLRRYC